MAPIKVIKGPVRVSGYNVQPASAKKSVDKKQNKRLRRLEGLVQPEHKVHDLAFTKTPDNTGLEIIPLTTISQGDDYNTRSGRKFAVTSVALKGEVKMSPSSATMTTLRVMVFTDKATNGVLPTSANILQTHDDLNSFLDYDTFGPDGRFKVLMDKFYTLSNSGTKVKRVKFYKKFYKHVVDQEGDGSDIASARTGHIYVAFMSNEPENQPEFNFNTRTRFIDN